MLSLESSSDIVSYLKSTVKNRALSVQGFPILKHSTLTSQKELNRLFKMGIKVAHLPSDIVHT
jgi:hypothetical protein